MCVSLSHLICHSLLCHMEKYHMLLFLQGKLLQHTGMIWSCSHNPSILSITACLKVCSQRPLKDPQFFQCPGLWLEAERMNKRTVYYHLGKRGKAFCSEMNENIRVSSWKQMEVIECLLFLRKGKEEWIKGEINAVLKPRKRKSENTPKMVGSGRWADCCLLTAAVVPKLIFAKLSIPVSAIGIMGPTQHHVSSTSRPRDGISTISDTALITCKEMILLRKAAQTINTFA